MFGPVKNFDQEYAEKHWKPETTGQIAEIASRLEGVSNADWNTTSIEAVIRAYAEELGLSAGKLIHPLRYAITGKRVGAGMFETMEVLGKAESLQRLQAQAAAR